MKEKKLKQSALVVILYLFAALMLVYTIYQIYSTCTAISSYYAQYDAAPKAGEIIGYILQAVVQPLSMSILLFGGGRILSETRALNPNNYEVVKKPAPAAAPAKKEEKPVATAAKKEETKKVEDKKAPAKKPAAKKTTKPAKEKVVEKGKLSEKEKLAEMARAKKNNVVVNEEVKNEVVEVVEVVNEVKENEKMENIEIVNEVVTPAEVENEAINEAINEVVNEVVENVEIEEVEEVKERKERAKINTDPFPVGEIVRDRLSCLLPAIVSSMGEVENAKELGKAKLFSIGHDIVIDLVNCLQAKFEEYAPRAYKGKK